MHQRAALTFVLMIGLLMMGIAPAWAEEKCWKLEEFKAVTTAPGPDKNDLTGPAYTQFMRWAELTVPPSDEVYIVADGVRGAGASVILIFFKDGCAVGKGSLPTEIWADWVQSGKGS